MSEPTDAGNRVAHGIECSQCGMVCDGVGELANHDCGAAKRFQETTA